METNKELFTIKGIFKKEDISADIIDTELVITEFIDKKESLIFLGKEEDFDKKKLIKTIKAIISNNRRSLLIDVETFISQKITKQLATKVFEEEINYQHEIIWNKKTGDNKPKAKKELILINGDNKISEDSLVNAKAINWARNLQQMAPNELNSEKLAEIINEEFIGNHTNIKVRILNKDQIKEHGMNLLLSVNAGSTSEARVVVLEYNGNPLSEEKTVMVGKGITFDSGGYDIKINSGMIGMKYDMSGSVIVAGAMKIISHLEPKANISAVMMITDNKLSLNSTTPDSVVTSMSGKTVEISDTDAEGRLVLADGLTYSVKELKATKLIDVATLTGTVVYQLGSTYTGIWATNDEDFKMIDNIAKEQGESIWRMPFHEDYSKGIKSSDVADLMNYSSKVKQDSQQAAMFLKEFTDKKPFIHLDVAGTAEVNGKPTGAMIKTLGNLF